MLTTKFYTYLRVQQRASRVDLVLWRSDKFVLELMGSRALVNGAPLRCCSVAPCFNRFVGVSLENTDRGLSGRRCLGLGLWAGARSRRIS